MFFFKNIYLAISICFCFFIFGGALLFYILPTSIDQSLSFTDSFFLSTSALSVTGLSSVPLASLSLCGKIILMILMFIGGIGLATLLISIAVYIYKSRIDFVAVATKIFDTIDIQALRGIIKTIIYGSTIILFVGTFLFYIISNYYSISISLFDLFFMTINTFTNAGFIPYNIQSKELYISNLGIFLSTGLILLGSLGFLFIYELCMWINSRKKKERYFFSLTLRIGFSIYFYTAIIAAFFFFILINNFSFRGILESLFYAVSARSCGLFSNFLFNVSPFFLIFTPFYAFAGTLPLSTGSGLKTSILGILLSSLKSFFSNEEVIVLKERSIPISMAVKTFIYCFYMITITTILVFFLRITTTYPDSWLIDIFIDAIGVITNSGISSGLPFFCSILTKWILIIGMILGRLGIIFLLIWQKPVKKKLITYPEEEIILI